MALIYQAAHLRLGRGVSDHRPEIEALQRDLRRLGYLRTGIDGSFGIGTEAAILALQYDLTNDHESAPDGRAPVRIRDYNRGRVAAGDGVLDQNLAAVIADMLEDERFAKVPESADPERDNSRVAVKLASMQSTEVPVPFLIAILKQESGLKHYREPTAANKDNFVVVGLDRNKPGTPAITSRGYGAGQYTLFHHPPTAAEVRDFILDPCRNADKTIRELSAKFSGFVIGPTPATRASDRIEESGTGPLRRCCYKPGDARYMRACRECLMAVGKTDVILDPAQYHSTSVYRGVPVRRNIGCDWPYAVRRYNGAGPNSYHYQAQVLLRVLNG
jgi:peptidoglycan hydrolase-like protein with peptidoglycan-binding domain